MLDQGGLIEVVKHSFSSLIVGFGRAGRQLHMNALRRLDVIGVPFPVSVVDPRAYLDDFSHVSIQTYTRLADVHDLEPQNTVVHVCTPPPTHLAVIEEAASFGYRRLIVEKPMVTSEAELDALAGLIDRYGLDLLVVGNWTSSTLTTAVQEDIAARAGTGVHVTEISIRHVKPRIEKSIRDAGGSTVFDIELPHMVAVAILLAGDDSLRVEDARSEDMDVGGVRLPHLANADVTLVSERGLVLRLHSDLLAPRRERSIQVAFSDGTSLLGYYPCSDADSYSQLLRRDAHGLVVERCYYFDDTLAAFFTSAYSYYAGIVARPLSDYSFNAVVCRLLNDAFLRAASATSNQRQAYDIGSLL